MPKLTTLPARGEHHVSLRAGPRDSVDIVAHAHDGSTHKIARLRQGRIKRFPIDPRSAKKLGLETEPSDRSGALHVRATRIKAKR